MSWLSRLLNPSPPPSASPPPPAPAPTPDPQALDPDQTWKVLDLVIDWLKHAEAKAAATLAATGVTGGVLYRLISTQNDAGLVLSVSAVVCFIFTVGAGLLSAWSLKPRLRAKDAPTSPLYFHHIARAHPRSGGTTAYRQAIRQMASDQEHLMNEVADQIWNNAQVATDKYKYANLALVCLLVAVIALGAVATTLAFEGL